MIFKNIKLKYKKISILLGIILMFYISLVYFAKEIETIATFPAILVNVQDVVGHIEEDLDYEEINISDSDGNNINGLYSGIKGDEETKTIYYFHGNGGPLSYFYSEIEYINSLGYNVIAYDYPGYGKSTGFPNKELVDSFSDIFYEYMKKEKNLKDKELILWGYSVGTAVVTDFASKHNFDKLVLVSPLASRYDMAKKIFGFYLSRYLFLDNSYITKELIKNIKQPILIIHGNNDKIVPFDNGKLIFNNAITDKSFIEIDKFGHNGIIDIYGKSLKGFIKIFLELGKIDLKNNYFLLNKQNKNKLEQKNKKLDFIDTLDLETDNSLQKFVTSDNSFNNKSYIPENLVSINSGFIYDMKLGRQIVKNEANIALQKMGKAFYEKFNKRISVISAYRSYNYQKGIKNRGCPDRLCAKAGFSEHQSGLAVDLWETTTNEQFLSNKIYKKYFDWLNENAQDYGFHNTYQKGLEIDGYEIEPWHWRYLGVELATHLKENYLTIAEFYNKIK